MRRSTLSQGTLEEPHKFLYIHIHDLLLLFPHSISNSTHLKSKLQTTDKVFRFVTLARHWNHIEIIQELCFATTPSHPLYIFRIIA